MSRIYADAWRLHRSIKNLCNKYEFNRKIYPNMWNELYPFCVEWVAKERAHRLDLLTDEQFKKDMLGLLNRYTMLYAKWVRTAKDEPLESPQERPA